MLLMNKCDKRTQVQLLLELHHSTALIWSVCFNPTFLSPATTYIIGTQISSNLEPGGRHRANGQDPGRAVRKNHLKKYQMCVLAVTSTRIKIFQRLWNSVFTSSQISKLCVFKAFHFKRCLNYQSKAILGLQWQQKAMNSKCGSSMFWPKVRLRGIRINWIIDSSRRKVLASLVMARTCHLLLLLLILNQVLRG